MKKARLRGTQVPILEILANDSDYLTADAAQKQPLQVAQTAKHTFSGPATPQSDVTLRLIVARYPLKYLGVPDGAIATKPMNMTLNPSKVSVGKLAAHMAATPETSADPTQTYTLATASAGDKKWVVLPADTIIASTNIGDADIIALFPVDVKPEFERQNTSDVGELQGIHSQLGLVIDMSKETDYGKLKLATVPSRPTHHTYHDSRSKMPSTQDGIPSNNLVRPIVKTQSPPTRRTVSTSQAGKSISSRPKSDAGDSELTIRQKIKQGSLLVCGALCKDGHSCQNPVARGAPACWRHIGLKSAYEGY